jgi:predicted nucleotidyltransferase
MRDYFHEIKMKTFLAKDFIQTQEGLVFAVVETGLEQGRALCFLRYVNKSGQWVKVDTEQANSLLAEQFPQYCYFSPSKDAFLHAVPINRVCYHHQPRQRLRQIIEGSTPGSPVLNDLIGLVDVLETQGLAVSQLGVTGSILLGCHTSASDMDLVIYDRATFMAAREIISSFHKAGIAPLTVEAWRASFKRRACELTFAEYCWHERRKFNKGLFAGRKFDISYVAENVEEHTVTYKKQGVVKLTATIVDSDQAFDHPAIFVIDHPEIKEICCYTPTYTGQAVKGERVRVSGFLEQDEKGQKRIVVGSNREAGGEYLKVISDDRTS